MDTLSASERLGALGHETRLSIFRQLVEAGPPGLAAGALGERLGLAPATLSFHLSNLTRVGLIHGRQDGRFVIYSADFKAMNALIAFLTENCCHGQACTPEGVPAETPGCGPAC